jgi:hypothetical protein
MADRIFHNWLQNEIGNHQIQRLWFNLHVNCESVLETDVFDVQVTFQKLQFLFEVNSLIV